MSVEREPIGVIGTGYVGLVTAVGFAEAGSHVWCVDIDQAKIKRLRRGEVPIHEPGLQELLERNGERLDFSAELSGALENARLLFVAVGTPPTASGDADLSAVHEVVGAMPSSGEHALVMKSTVPCGTGASIKRILREERRAGFSYVSCPEFLKEGSAVADFLHPDRVVIGDDGDWAGDAVARLYEPFRAPLIRTDIASAEMIKLASNAFLATKISFINEIANVCEALGADVIEVNELQKRRVVAKLQRHLGELASKRIALLGLAFKPNTDDMRGASSIVLAARLRAEGAEVRAYDPIAEQEARKLMPALQYASSAHEAVSGADAVVLVTEWPEFVQLDFSQVAAAMRGNVVIDGRNALNPQAVRAAGLIYEGVGRR